MVSGLEFIGLVYVIVMCGYGQWVAIDRVFDWLYRRSCERIVRNGKALAARAIADSEANHVAASASGTDASKDFGRVS